MAQTQTLKMNVNDVAVKRSRDQSFLWANPRSKTCCASIISRKRYLTERSIFNTEFFNNFQFSNWQNLIVDSGVFSRLIRCTLLHVPKSKLVRREHSSMEPHYLARTHFGKKNTSVLCFNFTQLYCYQYSRKKKQLWRKWVNEMVSKRSCSFDTIFSTKWSGEGRFW